MRRLRRSRSGGSGCRSWPGPLAQALAGMEPEVREEIRERALARASGDARRGVDGGVELDGSVLIGWGTRPT